VVGIWESLGSEGIWTHALGGGRRGRRGRWGMASRRDVWPTSPPE